MSKSVLLIGALVLIVVGLVFKLIWGIGKEVQSVNRRKPQPGLATILSRNEQ